MTTPLSGKPTFGAGRAFMIGNYAHPTPARALVPQSQSIDFKRKTESLFGEKQLAVAVGAGEMEITGKVEFGKVNPRIFADIMFGDGSTTGSYLEADKEAGTVPGTSTYVVTVANSANFLFDLGVVNADTGVIMSCVAAASEVLSLIRSVRDLDGNAVVMGQALGAVRAQAREWIESRDLSIAGAGRVLLALVDGRRGAPTGLQ